MRKDTNNIYKVAKIDGVEYEIVGDTEYEDGIFDEVMLRKDGSDNTVYLSRHKGNINKPIEEMMEIDD